MQVTFRNSKSQSEPESVQVAARTEPTSRRRNWPSTGRDDATGVTYSFDAPDAIDAGKTLLRFTNAGSEPHELNVFRLDGIPLQRFIDLLGAGKGATPAGSPTFTPVGGIQAVVPGVGQTGTVDFQTGEYALICFVPNADGAPHFTLGMVRALTVR